MEKLILFDIIICTLIYMIYPVIKVFILKAKLNRKRANSLARNNSIVVFIFLCLTNINNEELNFFVGMVLICFLSIIYYLINRKIFAYSNMTKKEKNTWKKIEKLENEWYTLNQLEDDEISEEEKIKMKKIRNEIIEYKNKLNPLDLEDMGVKEGFDEELIKTKKNVPKAEVDDEKIDVKKNNREEEYDEEDSLKTNNSNKNTKDNNIKLYCSSCGAELKESDKYCPKCGESFDEDESNNKEKESINIDQKYYDLIKLKELYDKKIITKEEFEKEKKKILE